MPKVFISGPMTGHPNYNYQAFENAAHDLRSHGIDVVSPVDLDMDAGYVSVEYWVRENGLRQFTHVALTDKWCYEEALLGCIHEIVDCDYVVTLPGWQWSLGAQAEVAFADALVLTTLDYASSGATNIFGEPIGTAAKILQYAHHDGRD